MVTTIILGLAGAVLLILVVLLLNRNSRNQGNAHHDGMYYIAHDGNQSDSAHQTGDWGGREVSHDSGGFDSGDSGGGDGGGDSGGDGGGGE